MCAKKVNVDHSMQAPRARLGRLSWRAVAFVVLLVAYLLVTLGIVHRSPLLTLDLQVVHLDLYERWPKLYAWIHTYVVLGQRGPSTLVAVPWFLWRMWKSRSARPGVMLLGALIVLNITVGIVKVATGRIGPLRTHDVHNVFAGGNIFPSGHTANAVVLYGIIAMVAVTFRRTALAAAIVIPLTVGLSTVYLDTHWLTDVVGGWMAGGLVLLALPALMPLFDWCYDLVSRTARNGWRRLRGPRTAPGAATAPAFPERLPAGPVGRPAAGHRPHHPGSVGAKTGSVSAEL